MTITVIFVPKRAYARQGSQKVKYDTSSILPARIPVGRFCAIAVAAWVTISLESYVLDFCTQKSCEVDGFPQSMFVQFIPQNPHSTQTGNSLSFKTYVRFYLRFDIWQGVARYCVRHKKWDTVEIKETQFSSLEQNLIIFFFAFQKIHFLELWCFTS